MIEPENIPTTKKGLIGKVNPLVKSLTKRGKDEAKTAWQIAKSQKVPETNKRTFFYRAWQAIKKTLAGQNKAGQILEIAKGLALTYLPFGSQLKRVTDLIGNALKTNNTMSKKKETIFKKVIRFLKQKTTQGGIAVLVAICGYFFGTHIDVATLTSSVIGVVTGLASLWAAVKAIIDIFKDEDK